MVLRPHSFFRPSGNSRIPTYLLILSGHKICMSLGLSVWQCGDILYDGLFLFLPYIFTNIFETFTLQDLASSLLNFTTTYQDYENWKNISWKQRWIKGRICTPSEMIWTPFWTRYNVLYIKRFFRNLSTELWPWTDSCSTRFWALLLCTTYLELM